MADEYCFQTKRRHRHPEGRSLSHISPINTVKPVLISTSAAMRGFMQLRDMMIMAIMMQRVLGQPKTNEKGVDQWSSSGWQQSNNKQPRDEGWEEGEWQSSDVAQCYTDQQANWIMTRKQYEIHREEVSKLSSRSQEEGKEVVVRPRWNEQDQENLAWADKKNLQWKIESKKRGAGGNRRRLIPAIRKEGDSDDEFASPNRCPLCDFFHGAKKECTVYTRCKKHDRDEEEQNGGKSAKRGEPKVARKYEDQKENKRRNGKRKER